MPTAKGIEAKTASSMKGTLGRPIRIAWVTHLDVMDRGGQVNLLRLLTSLDPSRYHSLVLVPGRGELFRKISELHFDCVEAYVPSCTSHTLWRHLRFWPALLRPMLTIQRYVPDILYVDDPRRVWAARMLAAGTGAKILWHAQTDLRTLRDARQVRQVDQVVAVAPHVARQILDLAPNASVECIPNAVDVEHFCPGEELQLRAELGARPNDPVILHVGGIYRSKGVGDLIEAFALLVRQEPQAWLWLVGTGDDEAEMRALVERHGIGARTRFLGRRDDVVRFYRAASVFVLASHSEGLPLALMEAMSSGTVCVGSDIPGIAPLLQDDAGMLSPVNKPDVLACNLLDLIGNPHRQQRLARQARRRIVEAHRIEHFVQSFNATLERLVGHAS